MSASTRLDPPKIEFTCTCGKRYRVPSSKAGKRVRCKNCRIKVRVPGETAISVRSRKAILEELGISEHAGDGADGTPRGTYHCALCSAKLPEDDVSAAYGADGLACAHCRAAMGGGESGDEGSGGAGQGEKKKKSKKQLDSWSRTESSQSVRRKAWAYGALFFVGTTGFVHSVGGTFLDLHPAWAVVAGVAAAYGGFRSILAAYDADEAPQGAPAKSR